MKPLKIKSKAINFKWLPPAEEWDFRSVTAVECRIACHWEYERQASRDHPLASGPAVVQKYCPKNYGQAARELFPQAWQTLTKEQREKVVGSFSPAPVLQVRKLKEFFKRMPSNGVNQDIVQSYLKNAYVIIPNFPLRGVGAVLREFEMWARQEAKQYRPPRRAQAAELPFDSLKWLAVLRVDQIRRAQGVTINMARETLEAYQRKHRARDIGGVFPIYASDGAWSKATKDAKRCLTQSQNNPSLLLADLA